MNFKKYRHNLQCEGEKWGFYRCVGGKESINDWEALMQIIITKFTLHVSKKKILFYNFLEVLQECIPIVFI